MQQHLLKNNLMLMLREAEPGDAEQLLLFLEQTAGESENITRSPGELKLTVEREREILQTSLESPTNLVLLAEIAGEIAGSLNFHSGERQRTRHAGEIGLLVLRKYWGLGIGGYLLASLIAWARGTGVIRKIDLHVRVDNLAAIHLYEKYGFVREGRISRELFVHGEFIDLYAMGLLIDPPEMAE